MPSHEIARIGGKRARIGGRKKVNEFKDGLLILIGMLKLFFSKSLQKKFKVNTTINKNIYQNKKDLKLRIIYIL